MIIAIDETGDFSPTSDLKSFFVAVLIEQNQNGVAIKKKQFDDWKATIPASKINEKGEIKGKDLSDEELLSFVQNVYKAEPILRSEVVFFEPKENPESLMKTYKEIEVKALLSSAQLMYDKGSEKAAKQYENMAIWHKNATKMHYIHFLKLILLRSLIPKAFNQSVGVSMLLEILGTDKEHMNLLNIQIKIDQDFVRGRDANIFWKELLRNTFLYSTLTNPVPLLDEWKTQGHPFIEKYKGAKEEYGNYTDLLKNNCDFLESHEHFELQLVDITAIIINRFHNKNKAISAHNALNISQKDITKLVLNKEPNFNSNPKFLDI